MKYFVAPFCGSSRTYLRFTIFALVTLIVALTVAGCVGATGATKPAAVTQSSSLTSITTQALPTGDVNEFYATYVTAQGGVQPYHWSITSGTLPTGIGYAPSTGEIAGTPTAAGTSSFMVKVTDSSATPQTSSQALTLTVAAAGGPLTISGTPLPIGYLLSNYTTTLHVTGGTGPYVWSLDHGTFPNGLKLSSGGVISGIPTESSTYSFGVQVQDSSSPQKSAARYFTLAVYNANQLEVLTGSLAAGKDGTAYSASLAARGGKTPYAWSLAAGKLPAGLTLASSGVISGMPTNAGISVITAEVRDSSTPVQTAERVLFLSVSPGSPTAGPLSITTSALAAGKQKVSYAQPLAATGGKAPYTWSMASGQLPSGLGISTGGMISGTPTAAGTFSVTAEVRDSSTPVETSEKAYTLTVAPATSTVTPLSILTTSLTGATENLVYSATLSATGGTKPYTWSQAGGSLPAGVTLGSSGILSGAPTASGSFQVLVQVKDTSSPVQTASQYLTLVVAAPTANLAITTASVANGTVNLTYSSTLGASGGTTPYTWSLGSGSLPTGVTLSPAGVISGMPKTSGTYTLMSKVTDSETVPQTATKQFTFSINAAVTTLAISTTSVPAGTVNTAYSTTLAATGGTTPYTWSLSSGALPKGVSISSAGTVSGTPTASGSFTFVAQVTDSSSTVQTATKQFTFSISAAVTTLAISTPSVPAGKVSTAYSTALAATGGTTPYTWSLSSGALPKGVTISSAGTISGTPTASGSFTFVAQVTDSSATVQTATKQFSLSVSAAASTLAISTASVPAGKISTAYSTTLAATGGTTPYTWSLAAGAFPKGVSISSTGTISGTPTASGSFTFVAEVTDSGSPVQTAQMTYSLSISGTTSNPIAITTSSLAAGKVGTAYSATLGASGGVTPYKWSLTSGSLNAGLSLSSAGAISGTPTAAGTASFTVQVTDSSSPALTATQTFSLVVASNTSTLSITTTNLADGQVGASYSATAAATGGTTPYTWSVASGSLPAGLTLGASTGTISGSPSASGTSSFTLKVTDSSSPSQTASQTLSIVVSAAASGTSLTACGTLSSAGATYVLQNDVSASQTCFSIQADNITLNLNGHTITYNTGSNSGAFGISGIACWDSSNPSGNPCGGSFDGFTVYGGSIVEGSGSTGTFSHCIRIGQGLITGGPTVHDTTFTFQTEAAMGIYVDYAGTSIPGAAIIYNNTFHNNDTTIVSRYNIDGASIRLDQGQATTTGAQVYNNTIIGGPQGGILDETVGGAVYGNTISTGTVGSNEYTNDFAIYAWEQNINVHNNTITPSQGRGVSIDATSYPTNGTVVQSNNITVIEKPDDGEYGGCELDGTYGVQYDDNAASASDVSNTVIAEGQQCNGGGLRLTAVGTGDTSSNNSYTGKLLSGAASGVAANGLSIDSGGQPGFTATRDSFIGDTASIYVDWDGAGPFTCISCTLGSGPEPSNYTTFYFWNGGTAVTPGGMHFRDTTFTGSASKTSTSMTVPGTNGTTAEYWIDWTYTLTVEDGAGAAVSGASVSITDALGNNIYSGSTNSSGQVSAVVSEFRMHNSGTSAVQEMRTPDAVTISAGGCTTLSYSVTVAGTMSDTRSLSGTCN